MQHICCTNFKQYKHRNCETNSPPRKIKDKIQLIVVKCQYLLKRWKSSRELPCCWCFYWIYCDFSWKICMLGRDFQSFQPKWYISHWSHQLIHYVCSVAVPFRILCFLLADKLTIQHICQFVLTYPMLLFLSCLANLHQSLHTWVGIYVG